METREIFDAAPLSMSQFLSETGQGLYVPPYQRQYNWEASKINRLLSDVAHGLNKIIETPDSICFLGTIIALRDLEYTTVDPIYRPQVPAKVMTIIDGQQRLTSLLLLSTVLHEEIQVRKEKLGYKDTVAEWCYNQALDVTGRLSDCYEEDMRYGDHRYYPRLIRSYHDVWSRNKGEARYKSPIGFYLHNYGEYGRNGAHAKPYTHVEMDEQRAEGVDLQTYRHLNRMRDHMRSSLRRFVGSGSANDEEITLPLGAQIGQSRQLQLALFNSHFPDSVVTRLTDEENAKFSALVRLIVFANYLLNRVTVAVVTAKREDYGFDMFEALNTTGQSLTAIETFKPKAIQAETLDSWKGSESKQYFDVIEEYVDREAGSSADRRQSVTSTLLIPFALLQNGTKLSKRLNDQRSYLRNAFEKPDDLSGQRMVLSTLSQVARFYDGPWVSMDKVPHHPDDLLRRQAGISLAALHDGKHDIVVALLTRYFAAYRLSPEEEVEHHAEQFLLAARSCAAFYAVWRGAFGGTNGIDGIYRSLMGPAAWSGRHQFARFDSKLTDVPPVEEAQGLLRTKLQEQGLHKKELWVGKASKTAMYKVRPLAKLLLAAASQNSTPDHEHPGLIVRGREGLLNVLDHDQWNSETLRTIEHIAPQNPKEGDWDTDIYSDPEIIDTIGNLTLLPPVQNSQASNRSWYLKRILFQALSSATVEEAEIKLENAARQGIELGRGAEKVAREAHYLPLVAALARYDGHWSAGFIQERSERICSLAWDSLAPWLGLEG